MERFHPIKKYPKLWVAQQTDLLAILLNLYMRLYCKEYIPVPLDNIHQPQQQTNYVMPRLLFQ